VLNIISAVNGCRCGLRRACEHCGDCEEGFGGEGVAELGTQDSGLRYLWQWDADGAAGEVLVTDGAGNLSWIAAGLGGDNIYTADGTLTGDRIVTSNGNNLTFTGNSGNSFNFLATDGTDQSTVAINQDEMEFRTQASGNVTNMMFNSSGMSYFFSNGVDSNYFSVGSAIEITDGVNSRGAVYGGDYEANFLPRSLVTKQYVDSVAGGFITDLNVTVATTSGSFSSGGFVGYEAAKDMCEAEYPGSHFCRTNEVIEYIDRYGAAGFTGSTAWIAEGPPGYTSNSNDCNGWTSADSLKLGAFWHFVNPGGGMGWLTNCAVTKPVACCE